MPNYKNIPMNTKSIIDTKNIQNLKHPDIIPFSQQAYFLKNSMNNLSLCFCHNNKAVDDIKQVYQSDKCKNLYVAQIKSTVQESKKDDKKQNMVISTKQESLNFIQNQQLPKIQRLYITDVKQTNIRQNKINSSDQYLIEPIQKSQNLLVFQDKKQNHIQLNNSNCCQKFISQKSPCKFVQNVYDVDKDQFQQYELNDLIQDPDQHDSIYNQAKKKKIQRKILVKGTAWTYEQSLKYITYLTVHKEDFNKKKFLLNQCSQYATNGNKERVRNRHYTFSRSDKNITIDEIIQNIKIQYKITDDQIEEEKLNLKSFKQKKFQHLLNENTQNCSQLIKLFKKTVITQQLPQQNFEFDFGQLNKLLTIQNMMCKIIPYQIKNLHKKNKQKNSISQQQHSVQQSKQIDADKQQRIKARFMINFQCDLLFDIKDILTLLETYQNQINNNQNKLNKELNLSEQLIYLSDWNLKNKINQSQTINKIYGINYQNNQQDDVMNQCDLKNEQNNTQKKKTFKPWTNEQQMKFLAFISVYPSAYSDNITTKVSRIMADYIQTRNCKSCFEHTIYFATKFKNVSSIKQELLSKINIDQQYLQIMINQLKKKVFEQKEIILTRERYRQIKYEEQNNNLIEFLSQKMKKQKIKIFCKNNL